MIVAYVNYSGREASDCAMPHVSTSLVTQYAAHSKINPHYPFFLAFLTFLAICQLSLLLYFPWTWFGKDFHRNGSVVHCPRDSARLQLQLWLKQLRRPQLPFRTALHWKNVYRLPRWNETGGFVEQFSALGRCDSVNFSFSYAVKDSNEKSTFTPN